MPSVVQAGLGGARATRPNPSLYNPALGLSPGSAAKRRKGGGGPPYHRSHPVNPNQTNPVAGAQTDRGGAERGYPPPDRPRTRQLTLSPFLRSILTDQKSPRCGCWRPKREKKIREPGGDRQADLAAAYPVRRAWFPADAHLSPHRCRRARLAMALAQRYPGTCCPGRQTLICTALLRRGRRGLIAGQRPLYCSSSPCPDSCRGALSPALGC